MRPIRLTIEGINSFTEPQTLDFERVGADNLFCVSGVTGSGKTTILDCMVLSLYPKHGKRGNLEDYINLRRSEGKIDFVFELGGEIYETRRVISRKAGKNSFVVLRGGDPTAEGTDGFRLIGDKIGLEMDEFTNVVVLQQGEFAKFLQAGKSQRVALISKLFDLKRFDGIYARFNVAAAREEGETKRYEGIVDTYSAITRESVKEAETALGADEKTLAEIAALSQKLDNVYENLRREYELFAEQTAIKKRIEDGEKKLAECAEREKKGEAALGEVKAENASLAEREKERDGLTAKKTKIENDKKRREEITARLKDNEKEKAACDEAGKKIAEREEKLTAARSEIAALETDNARLRDKLAEKGEGGFGAASEKLNEVKTRLDGLALAKAELDAAKRKLDETKDKKGKAEKEWRACEKAVSDCEKATAEAGKTLAAARAKLDEIVENNALAEVCAHVHKGDICPVCGGTVTKVGSRAAVDRTAAAEEVERAEKQAAAARDLLTKASGAARAAIATLDGLAKAEADETAAVKARELTAGKENEGELKAVAEILAELDRNEKTCGERMAALEKESVAVESDKKLLAARLETAVKRENELAHDLAALTEGSDDELKKIEEKLADLAAARKELDIKTEKVRLAFERLRTDKITAESGLAADKKAVKECREVKPEEVETARAAAQSARDEKQKLNDSVVAAREKLAIARDSLAKKTEAEKKYAEHKKAYDKYAALARLTKGNAFTEFVAAEYVKDFTVTASEKLGELTGGKYSLEYDETNGEFFVTDFLAGNERRNVKTLSGGETFLASLSLAIAISRDIARDKNFDFFFIDEGFGTLSPDALDAVTAALDALSRDTLVGIITHRAELIERIGSVVNVVPATEETGSRIV